MVGCSGYHGAMAENKCSICGCDRCGCKSRGSTDCTRTITEEKHRIVDKTLFTHKSDNIINALHAVYGNELVWMDCQYLNEVEEWYIFREFHRSFGFWV